ncbi:DUF4142 domain-containing protein [Aerophototrophica crusticola]|uniref:DUF4142 domain-containing protein n=1 Tax=Aerophototrophica crusticola TaxID=1709002 RepID=A0A858R9I4_9PROT|nr:DUF4142 domain-containing protein [Rhodospirillaceae bacterium B3]
MRRTLAPLLTLAALLAGPPAWAQVTTGGVPATGAESKALPKAGKPLAEADRSFLEGAIGTAIYTVEASRLAAERSDNEEVQQLAETLLTSQKGLHDDLTAIANDQGALPAAELDPPRSAMLEQLRQVGDGGFDQLWLEQQVDSQRRAVELYQQAAAGSQDGVLSSMARDALPTLQENLGALEQAAGAGMAQNQAPR